MEQDTIIVDQEIAPDCKACGNLVTSLDSYCQNCGFPLKASEEEQRSFINDRDYRSLELSEMNSKINSASTTMFVLAGLFAIMGIIYAAMQGDGQGGTAILIVNLILAALYVGLGFWAKQQPIAAIVSALGLFAVVQIIGIIEDPTNLFKGIVIKVIVIVYLVKGLNSAMAAQRIKKQYNL